VDNKLAKFDGGAILREMEKQSSYISSTYSTLQENLSRLAVENELDLMKNRIQELNEDTAGRFDNVIRRIDQTFSDAATGLDVRRLDDQVKKIISNLEGSYNNSIASELQGMKKAVEAQKFDAGHHFNNLSKRVEQLAAQTSFQDHDKNTLAKLKDEMHQIHQMKVNTVEIKSVADQVDMKCSQLIEKIEEQRDKFEEQRHLDADSVRILKRLERDADDGAKGVTEGSWNEFEETLLRTQKDSYETVVKSVVKDSVREATTKMLQEQKYSIESGFRTLSNDLSDQQPRRAVEEIKGKVESLPQQIKNQLESVKESINGKVDLTMQNLGNKLDRIDGSTRRRNSLAAGSPGSQQAGENRF
jgi:hypothetical protein